MASLEPPIPVNAARVVEMPLVNGDPAEEQGFTGWKGKAGDWNKWRRIVGLLLLFLTVFLWTVSNFLASVRRSRLLQYSTLTDFLRYIDDLRGQHVQQTLLRHILEHGVLHHPPGTDSDKEDPTGAGGN